MRLLDEYDAAQDRGEVAGYGGARNFNVPDENVEATAHCGSPDGLDSSRLLVSVW